MFNYVIDKLAEIGGSSLDVDRDVIVLIVYLAGDLGKAPSNTVNRVAKADSLHPAEETDDPAFHHRLGLLGVIDGKRLSFTTRMARTSVSELTHCFTRSTLSAVVSGT
jgi:hypothetical protein